MQGCDITLIYYKKSDCGGHERSHLFPHDLRSGVGYPGGPEVTTKGVRKPEKALSARFVQAVSNPDT
jgi:hypothetical protein